MTTEKEFNLSEKRYRIMEPVGYGDVVIDFNDVREFIRLLKEEIMKWDYRKKPIPHGGITTPYTYAKLIMIKHDVIFFIDKLAGEKLI